MGLTCHGFVGVQSQSFCLSCWYFWEIRLSWLYGLVGVYRSRLLALMVSVLQILLSWLLTGIVHIRFGRLSDRPVVLSSGFCRC